jgi:hypothetical protein
MDINRALKSRIPNLDGSFPSSDHIDPERGRLSGVLSLLDNIGATVNHCLASNPNQSNIPVLDVTDTTLAREGAFQGILRAVSFGCLGVPSTKEDLRSPAYQTFWKGLETRELRPFLALSTVGALHHARTVCVICISADDARRFLGSDDYNHA